MVKNGQWWFVSMVWRHSHDTIGGPQTSGYRAYKGFAAELCRRGFIVYAPQNPYRGGDRFRTLQRKSNVLGRSLFSYIIPQHLVALRWLSELPNVDPERIGFYGLSYGGKTAVRVPPMLPPTEDEPGYCLSICSADFNEWVAKNASVDAHSVICGQENTKSLNGTWGTLPITQNFRS